MTAQTHEAAQIDAYEARRAGYLGLPYAAPSPEAREVWLMAKGRRGEFNHWLLSEGAPKYASRYMAERAELGRRDAFDKWLLEEATERFHMDQGDEPPELVPAHAMVC